MVVDGGKEFHSIYFDSLLSYYKVIKFERPGGKPRFGSVCERLFGTANTTFINNLLGNTQATKNVRQITKEVNPKKLAVWTLGNFFIKLQEWAYTVYDNREHSALGISPREAFLQSMAISGKRKFIARRYDETFQMLSLPTTRKGNAKVQPGKGVKINGFHYWSDKLLHPEVENTQVPVRYDPYNMGIAYAYIHNQWILLNSTSYRTLVNRTEKEIQLATEEVRRRMKIVGHAGKEVTAAQVVNFLKSVEAEEVLQKQRLRDKEQKAIFEVISGGKSEKGSTDAKSKEKVNQNKVVSLNNKKKVDINSHQFVRLEEF